MKPRSYFAACAPALEPLLEQEVLALRGVTNVSRDVGGVAFSGHDNVLYEANLALGLASHVFLRVATFSARAMNELDKQLRAIPLSSFLTPGTRIRARARCRKSKLYHTGAVEQRVHEGAARQGLTLAREGEEAVELRARLVNDECTLSIDTSGGPLHRRGYRLASGKAPMREDLARAIVIASGWDRESPLRDPMMGAGTLAIEAALLATNTAPGLRRAFPFARLAFFDAARLEKVRARAEEEVRSLSFPIFGSDRDEGALANATGNAQRAGIAERVSLSHAAISAAPTEPATIVTNPPYGERVGESGNLGGLYTALGKHIGDSPFAIACPDAKLVSRTRLPFKSAFMTDHGGKKIRVFVRK